MIFILFTLSFEFDSSQMWKYIVLKRYFLFDLYNILFTNTIRNIGFIVPSNSKFYSIYKMSRFSPLFALKRVPTKIVTHNTTYLLKLVNEKFWEISTRMWSRNNLKKFELNYKTTSETLQRILYFVSYRSCTVKLFLNCTCLFYYSSWHTTLWPADRQAVQLWGFLG